MSNRKRTSTRGKIPAGDHGGHGGAGGHGGHTGRREHRPLAAPRDRAGGVFWKWKWMGIVLALAPAATFYGLGRYFEFHSPGAFDSGSYVYSAYRIIEGAQPGVDEMPSAKLGTLLVNIVGVKLFGFSETGPKLIQALLQAAALLMMFFTLRRLCGLLAGAVSVTVAALYLSAPVIAKFGNVKEQFMIAFMILAVGCLIWGLLTHRWWPLLAAGALAAWAPLFKETGVSVLAAMGVFLLVESFRRQQGWKRAGRAAVLLLAGGLLGLAPIYLWLAATDARLARPYSFVTKFLTSGRKETPAAANPTNPTNPTNPANPDEPAANPADIPTPNRSAEAGPAAGPDRAADGSPPAGNRTYVSTSRRFRGLLDQAPTVLRFYRLLILPIALAAVSIGIRLVGLVRARRSPAAARSVRPRPGGTHGAPGTPGTPGTPETSNIPGTPVWAPERFLVLLVVWWLLDMAFVWISPRSYEQYYLPLTASGAFLGGYGIGWYRKRLAAAGRHLGVWLAGGALAGLMMILMARPVVFGMKSSPHTGAEYDEPSRGYVQKYREISQRLEEKTITPWEQVADYIRTHSTPEDTIYVWGWYPGIYVRAQRLAPTREAAYGTMHSDPPDRIERLITDLVRQMEANPPRYLVDTQKMHFPFYDHPVYDLWPRWLDRARRMFDLHPRIYRPAGKVSYVAKTEYPRYRELFLDQVEQYCLIRLQLPSRQDGPLTAERAEPLAREERARQAAMEPLRDFVMQNYVWRFAPDSGMLLFEHVSTAGR